MNEREENNEDLESDELISKEESKVKSDSTFDKLAEGAAVREVDLPKAENSNGNGQVKTLDEQMDNPNLTDHQATLQFMFPSIPNKYIQRVSRLAMISRIFPEAFLDHIYLVTIDVVRQMERGGEEVHFIEVLSMVHHVYSIGLGGKGRIDGLELAGAAKEAELEKLSKMVGLND